MATENGVRLKVGKSILHEVVNGRQCTFHPGTVFVHPDKERAKTLLGITPALVTATNEMTSEEKEKAETTQKLKVGLATEHLRKQAETKLAEINKNLQDLGSKLRKGKAEEVADEAKKRGLEFPGQTPAVEDMVEAIVNDEREKLEAALVS